MNLRSRTPRTASCARASAAVIALLGSLATQAGAQTAARFGAELPAGGEAEEYLRYLQTTGEVSPLPWSVRGFGPVEADRLVPAAEGHPWAGRALVRRDTTAGALRIVPVRARMWYNSGFAYGTNDGAVWAGRGATVALDGGVSFRKGVVSAALAPMVFTAQNSDFEIFPNGQSGPLQYGVGRYTTSIDAPQRFGDAAYTRVVPGQSYIRVDTRGVAVGLSTANETWGPGSENPLILGTAGPGFPHAFAGTSRPVNVGIGRVHGRVLYARLGQSDYSPIQTGPERARFAAAIVGVFEPRGLTGLELGASRFFHKSWRESGIEPGDFLDPFGGVLKKNVRGDGTSDELSDAVNQLASAFFRWTLAPAGFEVYGEFARDDHSYDLRDLLQEPEHDSAYLLGVRRAWRPSPDRMVGVRAEIMDSRPTSLYLVRAQGPLYVHASARQGHTVDGQFLGSRNGFGGAGSILALDLYSPRGRSTAFWTREERGVSGPFAENPDWSVWVAHTLGAESLFPVGALDFRVRVAGVLEMNRYNLPEDKFNLNTEIGVQWRP